MKRLFIDRQYKDTERPQDYTFIRASVYDNQYLLKADPEYVRILENLPEDQRRADLEGDWNVFSGQYFDEFDIEIHTCDPFPIPPEWRRYFTMDYGLDMLAAYWIAMDESGKAYVYRELYKPKLIAGQAAREILACMPHTKNEFGEDTPVLEETIESWFAPGDLWNRRQETGKSVADIFRQNGITLTRSSNDRVNGWLTMKEWLATYIGEDGEMTARLVFFRNCKNVIRCLPMLQYDTKNANDVKDVRDASSDNHELTHAPDAIRYFINGRTRATDTPKPVEEPVFVFNGFVKQEENPFGIGVEATEEYKLY